MSADKHAKYLVGIVVLAAASVVLLHTWTVVRSSAGKRQAKRLVGVQRDLIPRVELPLNHSLRQIVLWRDDRRCGENDFIQAEALHGRAMLVPAGCNPKSRTPCCSQYGYCGPEEPEYCDAPESVNYKTDDRAFDQQILLLTQTLGPKAREFNLKGNEWRRDFLCGPHAMVFSLDSKNKADLREAACNPDSLDRYLCDISASTCRASVESTSFLGRSRKHIYNRNRTQLIDYRKRESWEARQNFSLSLSLKIQKRLLMFNLNTYSTTDPSGYNASSLLKGFGPRGAKTVAAPQWYYISMDTRPERGRRLVKELLDGGVRKLDITRVAAVTPAIINMSNWNVPGMGTDVEKAVTLSHLKAIKMAWENNKLRAKHGLPQIPAMIIEDDLSLELTGMWDNADVSGHSITLHDVFEALNAQYENWELCQLSMTCFSIEECFDFITDMAEGLGHKRVVLPRKSRGRHKSLWGAVAYVVSPRGQARILDMLWPVDGKDGPNLAELPNNATFRIGKNASTVADGVLYNATREAATFFSARPLFCSRTEHSHLHKSHLLPQARSNYLMKGVLYLSNINVQP